MDQIKIIFINTNRTDKCKIVFMNLGQMSIRQLKTHIIKTFFKHQNQKLISELKITEIMVNNSAITNDLFAKQYEDEDAFKILSKYVKCRIYFTDLRYTIHINAFDIKNHYSFDFPLKFEFDYEEFKQEIINKTGKQLNICHIFKNDGSQIQIDKDDIKKYYDTGLNVFLFPIKAIFSYQKQKCEFFYPNNDSIKSIRNKVQSYFNIKTNDFYFYVNDEIINNDDIKIHDVLKRYNEEPVLFNIILKTEIENAKKIVKMEENNEIQELKKSIEKLKNDIKNKDKIIKNKNDEIANLKEENIQLNRLKLLKKKTNSFVEFKTDEYQKLPSSLIGRGTFSNVTKVSKNMFYAKKELSECFNDNDSLKRFLDESKIIFELQHPCIIKIHGFNYGNEEERPSMILTLEPRSLDQAIKTKGFLTQADICRIAVEIVLGMRYIHSNKIIHRDLKPNNILLSRNNHVRICDFGIAKIDDPSIEKTNNNGTLYFMAPELCSDEDEVKYDNKIDVYAFAYVLLFIVTCQLPRVTIKNKMKNSKPIDIPKKVCTWVRELILSCLSYEPINRPTFNEILEIMKKNNYNLFSDKNIDNESFSEIQNRIDKIEAFEYLYQVKNP